MLAGQGPVFEDQQAGYEGPPPDRLVSLAPGAAGRRRFWAGRSRPAEHGHEAAAMSLSQIPVPWKTLDRSPVGNVQLPPEEVGQRGLAPGSTRPRTASRPSDNKATAEGIGAELRRIGFVEGPPSHIAPEIVDLDRRIYRNLCCGDCGHRGHKVTPMNRGSAYKLVRKCRKCGAETEA
jgi:hypothetical protein